MHRSKNTHRLRPDKPLYSLIISDDSELVKINLSGKEEKKVSKYKMFVVISMALFIGLALYVQYCSK